jgi:hypothetical protein
MAAELNDEVVCLKEGEKRDVWKKKMLIICAFAYAGMGFSWLFIGQG